MPSWGLSGMTRNYQAKRKGTVKHSKWRIASLRTFTIQTESEEEIMKREDVTNLFPEATAEQINALLDINSADIGKVKHRIEVERDNYKDSLETAQNALKQFEGVDVDDLKGKVAKLTADLTAKEEEYRQQLAERDLNDLVGRLAGEYKAHDVRAVMPYLDMEKLRASKNQEADLREAMTKLKEDSGFLFVNDEPIANPVARTQGSGGASSRMSLLEAMKYKNEHPDADIKDLLGKTGKE